MIPRTSQALSSTNNQDLVSDQGSTVIFDVAKMQQRRVRTTVYVGFDFSFLHNSPESWREICNVPEATNYSKCNMLWYMISDKGQEKNTTLQNTN